MDKKFKELPTHRICKKCGEDKPVDEFYINHCLSGKRNSTVRAICKECLRHPILERTPKWEVIEGKKRCPGCKTYKDLNSFNKNKAAPDGLAYHCRECQIQMRNNLKPEIREHRKTLSRNRNLMKKYKLTREMFENMRELQDHKCKICGREIDSSCHVDHDHSNLQVRGLLCNNCNLGLGNFKDNRKTMLSSTYYFKKYISDDTNQLYNRRIHGVKRGTVEKCEICGAVSKNDGDSDIFIVQDHNHKTGKCRGKLCTDCNTAIAMFNEDPEIILSAIKYLEDAQLRFKEEAEKAGS